MEPPEGLTPKIAIRWGHSVHLVDLTEYVNRRPGNSLANLGCCKVQGAFRNRVECALTGKCGTLSLDDGLPE